MQPVQSNIKDMVAFIRKTFNSASAPAGASLLEVGCDEGHLSDALAKEGYDVTGIDRSPEKIDAALKLQHEHLHFFMHDIRLPFHINYFDYAIILSGFTHYKKQREQYNAVRTVANSLKHQGMLLFEYHDGSKTPRLTLGDFNDMFSFHNLQMQEVYGDYELHPYDVKKSPRLIMIAKKK